MAAEIENISCDFAQPITSDYIDTDLILQNTTPCEKIGDRVNQMIEIIDRYLVEVDGKQVDRTKAEVFLENELYEFFNIPANSTNGKIVKKHFKELCKTKDNEAARKAKRPAISKTTAVDDEFRGLYTLEISSTGNVKVVPSIDKIAYRVIDELHVIVYKGNLYCYADNFYINSPSTILAEATRILNGICKDKNSIGISNKLKDVMTCIKNNNPIKEYPFNLTRNAINVNNGVLVIDEEIGYYHLEAPDPIKYVFNYKLPINFDENIPSTRIMEEIRKYSDKPMAIIQALAQMILQAMGRSPFKLAYLLYGPPNYGKSTLLEMYRKFVGKGAYSAIALGRMSSDMNNRFSLAPLEGKFMNLKDELSYFKIEDSTTFKDVTGSYDIWVEPKHVDAYAATSIAVHMFATNSTPNFDGRVRDDDAFWKRWVLIPCTKTRFEMNEKFLDTFLTDENMSGLLNEVMSMVAACILGQPLPYTPSMGDEWEKTREEWMQAGSPLYKFITENMHRGGETAIIKEELLSAVQKWCDDGHVLYKKSRPESVQSLSDTIRLCNGTLDEKRSFYNGTPAQLSGRIKSPHDHTMVLLEEKHCYVMPWTWNEDSAYKAVCREEPRKRR